MRKNREIVVAAINQYGYSLKYADESLKKDKEVVLLAVKKCFFSNVCRQKLKKIKNLFLPQLNSVVGELLWNVDDSLKKDKEIAIEAVKQCMSLQFIDEIFKKDKEIV